MARTRPLRLDQREIRAARALFDFLMVLIAFGFAVRLYELHYAEMFGREPGNPVSNLEVASIYGGILIVVLWAADLYRERASVLNLRENQLVIKGGLLAAALFFTTLFLFKLGGYSRFVTFVGITLSILFIVLVRRVVSSIVLALEFRGRLGRNVLIYGCGETGRLLMKKLVQAPHRACRVVGFIDDFAPLGSLVTCRLDQTAPDQLFKSEILGRLHDLPRLTAAHQVDELLVTIPLTNAERHQAIIERARELSIEVGVVPRLGELRADLLDVEDLSAIPVVRASRARPRRLRDGAKRIFDLLVSLGLLVLSGPLWVAAAILIKLDTPGPVFFRQRRIGKEGEAIEILKFRTMLAGADPYAPSPMGDIDPRITRVGRFLRMGGFDELPQLLNVIRGEMSVVGPRPEMPFIVESYTSLERQRLEVKPGITGIWQLSSDRHAEIHENIEYDLYYIRNQSLLVDALILLETLLFTIGIFRRSVTRRRVVPPEVSLTAWQERRAVEMASEGYVAAALDQRVAGNLPQSWLTCAPALYTLSTRWPVKVLMAPDNIRAFDTLVDTPGERNGSRTEYVPYTSRGELRALTLGARLVLTDLRHVEKWAMEAEKDVLFVNGDRVRWVRGNSDAQDMVDELLPLLPSLEVAPGLSEQQS